MTAKFNLGLTTDNKEDPEKVAREMKVVKHPNGQRIFGWKNFLLLSKYSVSFPVIVGKK